MKHRLVGVGVALLALAGSFGAGRLSARPPAVRDEVKVATTTKATATTETHAAEATRAVTTADVDTTTRVVTRWLPAVPAANGCPAVPAHVEQEATTERHAATTRTAETHRTSNETAKQEQQVQQTVVELHTVTPTPRHDWSAMALVGGQLGGRRLFEVAPGVVVGVALERRILGPVSIGAWGTTGMTGGVSVRVDW